MTKSVFILGVLLYLLVWLLICYFRGLIYCEWGLLNFSGSTKLGMQLVGAIWEKNNHFHIHDKPCVCWMCSTCVQKKSGTFLVAASTLASTTATVQNGRCHARIQTITILTRKTANISLTSGFFKLSNYRQLQFFSDIGNARQYC
jgi:hypothetical protein